MCKIKFCTALHWLCVLLVASSSIFSGSPQIDVDMFNMTLFCDDMRFNQTALPVDAKWPAVTIITVAMVSVLIVILVLTKIAIFGAKCSDFQEIFNYFLGLLMSWDVTYLLKGFVSFPFPSFYQNADLENYYCCITCNKDMTLELTQLDLDSRGSFPSFTTCSTAYASVYLFLLCCHLDNGKYFAAKLLALFIPGSVCYLYGWYLWQYHQNHFADVMVGALIGALIATYVMKSILLKEDEPVTEDAFLAILKAREIEMAELNFDTSRSNRYAINVYPVENDMTGSNELPPPYASLIDKNIN